MPRRYIYLFIAVMCLSVFVAHAQSGYFMHTLKKGETLSSLAKKYNTTAGDIMRLNKMHANSKLVYGSQIKIPGQAETLTQQPMPGTAVSDTALTYTTHTVTKGETLFSISKQYNVSVDDLIKWNNINGNAITVGDVLNIGGKKIPAVIDTPSVSTRIDASEKGEAEQPVITKTLDDEPEKKREIPQPVIEITPALSYKGRGVFEKEFHGSFRGSLQGMAMTFKTQAGWNDGKFYILMNDAEPGTVVKIESADGKTIYAKVLMAMQEIRENNGISFRLSNAAAAALGISDTKFGVTVSW